MAQRPTTRSKKSKAQLDLAPQYPIQNIPRKTRCASKNLATGANLPLNQGIASPGTFLEEQNLIKNDQQVTTGDEATILPCVNTSFSGTPEIITCSICFGPLSAEYEPMATLCGHIFCAACLTASLKKIKRCPTCQTIVKFSTCIRLYF